MATDIQVQSGISITNVNTRVMRGSDGTLYTGYRKTSDGLLYVAYSTNNGATWNEVSSTAAIDFFGMAIDSQDIVHFVYRKTSDGHCDYRYFSALTWSAEETVDASGTTSFIDVAIDSLDTIHTCYDGLGNEIYHNKRTSGAWGSVDTLSASTTSVGCTMVIDSNNYIYVFFNDTPATAIKYVKYISSWSAAVSLATGSSSDSYPNATVDSADNVHLIYRDANDRPRYIKYTKATDTWGSVSSLTLTSASSCAYPTIAVDASDVLTVVFQDGSSPTDIYVIQNTAGTWGSDSKILDATGSNAFTMVKIRSTIWPLIGGSHTNIATSGYQFIYYNTVSAVVILRYYSVPANYPGPQTQTYSRGASGALSTSNANLSSLFTTGEYTAVATIDAIFASQSATNQYAVFEFKNKNINSTDPITVTWVGQSSIAPTTSTVVLQIYNITDVVWETLASNSAAAANTNFTLTGTQSSNLSKYYDGSHWVSCRVYQLAQ